MQQLSTLKVEPVNHDKVEAAYDHIVGGDVGPEDPVDGLPATSQPAVAVTVEPAEDNTVDICYNVGSKDPVAGPSSASQRTVALAVDVVDDFVVCGDVELAREPSAMILQTTCQSCK